VDYPFIKCPPSTIDHFLVIQADDFAEAIRAAITDEEIRALPENLGAIDQFVDSTDVLSYPKRFNRLKFMYQYNERRRL
jgi:hypothetical protein